MRLCRYLRAGLLLPALLLAGIAPGQAESPPLPAPGLFGSRELRGPLTALQGWQRVVALAGEQTREFAACKGGACPPAAEAWQRMLKTARPLPHLERLKWVNRYLNQWPYRLDLEVYGRSDYWATPGEFLRQGGDCEDFSITKYFALRQLGYRQESLRIVVVLDSIRGIGHAVLAVEDEGEAYILDNLSEAVFSHRRYLHYQPQYSVNEAYRWVHLPPAEPFELEQLQLP